MSAEAWGDDDDGLDGQREAYRKTLLEDGWLDDAQATALLTTVGDLAMLVRSLCHALADPNSDLARRAIDYLIRKNLKGSPLRDDAFNRAAP